MSSQSGTGKAKTKTASKSKQPEPDINKLINIAFDLCCKRNALSEEDWEKGSLFCLHWECQLVNNHCKEQQNGAEETSRQRWPKIWSTHTWACCQGNYT